MLWLHIIFYSIFSQIIIFSIFIMASRSEQGGQRKVRKGKRRISDPVSFFVSLRIWIIPFKSLISCKLLDFRLPYFENWVTFKGVWDLLLTTQLGHLEGSGCWELHFHFLIIDFIIIFDLSRVPTTTSLRNRTRGEEVYLSPRNRQKWANLLQVSSRFLLDYNSAIFKILEETFLIFLF